MYQKMFSEFEDGNKKKWLEQVEKDRKGKEYNELFWPVSEKLILEPYYDEGDVNDLLINDLHQSQKASAQCLNQPFIKYGIPETENLRIHEAILGGADALWISINDSALSETLLQELLDTVSELAVPVVFECSNALSNQLVDKIAGSTIKGGLAFDPLSAWMCGENSLEDSYSQLALQIQYWPFNNGFRPIMVGGHAFHNAGGNVVQELAFTIALLVQYLDWLSDKKIPVAQVMDSLFISISVGTHYLTEIGKLRALRSLHKRVCDAYEIPCTPAFIHARTSAFYETNSLPDTNFIRMTVEAMAAIAGGCDALTVAPHFNDSRQSEEFLQRIGRNVGLVMEEEAYLGKVIDPAAGSYLIDKLTLELVESAWELFLKIEKKGGLVAAFQQNYIQSKLHDGWETTIEACNKGRVLVGVNKFADTKQTAQTDVFLEPITLDYLRAMKLEEGINNARS